MESNQNQAATQPKSLTLLSISDEAVTPLDQLGDISAEYRIATQQAANEFRLMAITAKAVALMRKALTDDLVVKFKALENSRLGFKTDKPAGGYDIETIRECVIEAVLRGVKIVGNEFNIIASNLYVTKEGFEGKTDRDDRFNKVRILPGIPVWEEKNGRAIVPYTATWEFCGRPMSLEGDVSVRLQKGSTDDQILGKATRKIYARMWQIAAGEKIPESDLEDVSNLADAKPAQVQSVKDAPRQHRPQLPDQTPKKNEAPTQPEKPVDCKSQDSKGENLTLESPTTEQLNSERLNLVRKIQQTRADCGFIEASFLAQLKKLGIADVRDTEDLSLAECNQVVDRWREINAALS